MQMCILKNPAPFNIYTVTWLPFSWINGILASHIGSSDALDIFPKQVHGRM